MDDLIRAAQERICAAVDRRADAEAVLAAGRLEYAHRSLGQRFRRLRESLLAAGPR